MINTFFKQILIFFLVIFAFLYLTNCATPHPILRMKPMQNIENSQQVFWKNGGSYIQEVQNEIGIRIGFSFFDKSQKLFLMEFEFVNFSANPILISPEKFYYTTFDTIQHQITKDAKLYCAVDPEKKILDLDKQIARKEASIKNSQTWAAIGAGVALVATTAAVVSEVSSAKNTSRETTNRSSNITETAHSVADLGVLTLNRAENNALLRAWEAQNIENVRENWEKLTLRKTHLFPQESIKGSVLFPIKDIAFALRYLKFIIPIESTERTFTFRQKWIKSEIGTIQNQNDGF